MSRHATARLFVAIDPPEEVREQLAAWARSALRAAAGRVGGGAALRVLAPESLHVTLCFLGERPVGEIAAIGARLATIAGHAGELSVGAPLWLPRRRPRALAVELHDDTDELARLHERVLASMLGLCERPREPGGGEPAGGRRGRRHRRFRPHVTVARMRAAAAPRERTLAPTPPLSFVPTELVLYRSWLSPDGASYEALASCAIG
jgi:RNA 2',3'-cyclic 3'-phosphodiesterase